MILTDTPRPALPGFAFWLTLSCAAVIALPPVATAQDKPATADEDYSDELPRIAPTEPAAALKTFTVQPGFRIEQVAAEPLVNDPVAVDFDENGRLFVVEMRGYSEHSQDKLGRVRLLEDTDGDGRFDTSKVYVDGLAWPTAVICYDGGIFVGAAPDIIYCQDTDGDDRADVRRVVFTGFGRGNVQGLLNSFRWGLDNRIHGAASSAAGVIRSPEDTEMKPVDVRGRDFAFDPRTLDFSATSGGAQHGMSFDDWGRKFVSSNSDHIQQVMFEDRYLARNPYLAAPSARRSIAADGPQATVYRRSPVEPWRIVRTRLRVAGAVPGPIEGGGRAAGYFTGATGVTIYRGNAWPEKYRGLAVVGDVGSNIVHRKTLERDGLQFTARRIDPGSEFVATTDIWFRPAQFANAPDGTLIVLDVYREVIEHPASLPPMIKRHLDLNSGRDRGRIYRVVADGFTQPPSPRLGRAATAELVATLAHPNGWHRETAARLIYQRRDRAAVEPLGRLARESTSALGRMHALYALGGLQSLTAEDVLAALQDADPRVREHAVGLSETVADDSPVLRERLYSAVSDDDVGVRYQLAFTLGELNGAGRDAALAALARRDAGDSWMRLAVLSSLFRGADTVFAQLAADAEFRAETSGHRFLIELARQIGARGRRDELAVVLRSLENLFSEEPPLTGDIVRALSEGARAAGNNLPVDQLAGAAQDTFGRVLSDLLAAARQTADDADAPVADRVEAIATLKLGSFGQSGDLLERLLDHRQPHEVQIATLRSMTHFDHPGVGLLVVDGWLGMSPRLRSEATEVLLARPERMLSLLDGVERGQIVARDLPPARVQMLTGHENANIRRRAAELFRSAQLGRRADVVKAYRDALDLAGDRKQGHETFKKICAACHRVADVGHEIGPNLAAMKNRGPETILVNVLDPNQEVNPQFVNYTVITADGRSLTGIIAAETATSVTLRRAEAATDIVLRVNIDEIASSGLSIMPEGMEKDITPQAMADLITYIMSLE